MSRFTDDIQFEPVDQEPDREHADYKRGKADFEAGKGRDFKGGNPLYHTGYREAQQQQKSK